MDQALSEDRIRIG